MKSAIRTFLCCMLPLVWLVGCTGMVFHPDRSVYATPDDFNLTYNAVDVSSLDGTQLSGWWIYPHGTPKGTVLVAHGNAENLTSHFRGFVWLVRAGYEVFMFDYRGYGASEGKADLEGAVQDTQAALRYVLAQRLGDITVVGQSLGGVMLMNALVRDKPERIRLAVFDSAFSSLPLAGSEVLSRTVLTWPFQWLVYPLLDGSYDPIDFIFELDAPKLFVSGSDDVVVSPNHSWQLFDAASRPRAFWLAGGMGHISALYRPSIQRALLAFMAHPDFPPDYSEMLFFDTIEDKKEGE